jgi:hypothetical protein
MPTSYRCGNGHELADSSVQKCPTCGSQSKNVSIEIEDWIGVTDRVVVLRETAGDTFPTAQEGATSVWPPGALEQDAPPTLAGPASHVVEVRMRPLDDDSSLYVIEAYRGDTCLVTAMGDDLVDGLLQILTKLLPEDHPDHE